MRHEYIYLSQNDPRWKLAQLGDAQSAPGATIGAYGCYITAFTVLANYYGHSIDPLLVNKLFLDHTLFASGDLVSDDDDLAKVFPDLTYTTSLHYENGPADLQILKDLLNDPTTAVIVMISLGNGNVHFTPVIDCDGTTVTIMNVWNGTEQDLKTVYGDPATKILKYVVYHGNPISLDPLVCDRKSIRDMLVGKATHYDDFVNAGYVNVGDVQTHVTALQTLNKNLSDQIESLKQQSVKTFTVSGTPTDTVAMTNPPSPVLPTQAKPISFWHTDIADLFKLFTKRGGKQIA